MNSLQRFLAVLVKHRRFIFWNVLIVTLGVMIYSLVARPVYTASAVLLPPVAEETNLLTLPSVLGASGFSSAIRLGSSLRGTQMSELVAAIIASRTIRERVIDSCDYIRIGRFRNREDALKALREATKIHVTDEGLVTFSVKAGKPDYAARLGNAYIAEVDRFLRESNMSRARNMRIFIGRRLAETDTALAAAVESLTAFQKRHQITAVDEETKAAIESYAKLQAEKMAQDAELRFAEELAGEANPYVRLLRQRNQEFERQLQSFERKGNSRFGVGLGVPLKQVPDVVAEYARRYADYKLKQELRSLLFQQYEQARIAEVRDTPTLTVLDPPVPPLRRSWPKRTLLTLLGFAVSLTVGVILSFFFEYWEQQRQDEKTWHEWQRLAHTLRLDRGIGRRIFGRPAEPSRT